MHHCTGGGGVLLSAICLALAGCLAPAETSSEVPSAAASAPAQMPQKRGQSPSPMLGATAHAGTQPEIEPSPETAKPLPDKALAPEASSEASTPVERVAAPEPAEEELEPDAFSLGEEAMALEDFRRAAEQFEAAVLADPLRERAHYNLAVSREKLGDLEGALRAYEKLEEVASNSRWRELASARRTALKRQIGRNLLYRADCLLDLGQWRMAIDPLGRAVDLRLPPSLDQRARTQYYSAVARLIAERVLAELHGMGAMRLGLAEFRVASEDFLPDTSAFQELLQETLIAQAGFAIEIRRFSAEGVPVTIGAGGDIYEEPFDPEAPVLTGVFGDPISVRLMTRLPPRDVMEVSLPRKGAVPPLGTNPAWNVLPQPPETRNDFDIEVWVDLDETEEKDVAEVKLRCSRDSLAAVYRLFSDGTMDRAFPSDAEGMKFVRGGQTIDLVPAGGNSESLSHKEVEGYWAVASMSAIPLKIDGVVEADGARRIREHLLRLPRDRWTASVYKLRPALRSAGDYSTATD